MPPTTADSVRVLVVDDDKQLLRTLSDILRRRGYTPQVASSGREGLAIAAESPHPAIALVDLRLPDMDGLELVGRLRVLSELTEMVILTGNASIDSAVRALREHSHDYLVKPVAPEQLLITVSRASERWRRRHIEEELRLTEERSHLLLENISDIVAVVDKEARITYASPSLVRRLGYSLDEVTGRDATMLIHSEDRVRVAELLQTALADPGATAAVEVRVRHRDSLWRTLECHVTNLKDRPVIKGFLITARDVTEARRLEAQFLQAQKMETVGNLAGGVAHDFNNILTAVIGFSDLVLSRPELDTDIRDEVQEIRKAGERAARVTRQLLTFSRQHATEPQDVQIGSLLSELSQMLRTLVGEDIAFEIRTDPELAPIHVDPTHVEQVVLNLVVNARDAMPKGGALILEAVNSTVRLQGDDGVAPGEYVRLTVRDSGVGMPEHVRERALEPFYTTKEPGKGTGLGLSTCYGILKQANGGIVIQSHVGAGTTVHTYWPRSTATRAQRAMASTQKVNAPRSSGRILIVDDDAGIRTLTMAILRGAGYQAWAAADPAEALSMLNGSAAPFDLLLTDIVLPGMTGWQLATEVVIRHPNVHVLFMSGYDRSSADLEAVQFRGIPLVKKPFTAIELASKVREVLTVRSGDSDRPLSA
jgi:two-component system cell cycle sensor histidine kinase/response regulator CckA